MVRIRRFSVIRTSNVAALLYLVVTAIFAIPVGLILLAAGTTYVSSQTGRVVDIARVSGVFVLFAPLLYATFGWVFTAIACLLYNLVARFTGGIEFEAVTVQAARPPMPPPPAPTPTGAAPPA